MAGAGHRLRLAAPGREARRGHSVALGTRRRSHRGGRRGESERAIRLRQPRRVHHPGGVHARPLGCAHGLQRRQPHEPSALAVPRSDGAHAARARSVRPAHRHRGAVASAAAIAGHLRRIRRARHLPRPGRRRLDPGAGARRIRRMRDRRRRAAPHPLGYPAGFRRSRRAASRRGRRRLVAPRGARGGRRLARALWRCGACDRPAERSAPPPS